MSTLDMSQQPISSLARSMMDADVAQAQGMQAHKHHCHGGHGWWVFLFWWLVIALIVYFTLFALKPDFVLEKDDYGHHCDELDQGKLLGSAIVISLIIIFVIWLFSWGLGWGGSQVW